VKAIGVWYELIEIKVDPTATEPTVDVDTEPMSSLSKG
jgi:hypothetical protein